MSSTAPFGSIWPTLLVAREDIIPTTRGPMLPIHGYVLARQRLSTDAIGTFSLTLTNLVVGSAIRIESASTGALVEFRTTTLTTEVFNVPAYSEGSGSNALRIKVRKGSSPPIYKAYETLISASVGSGSIYVSQIPD